MDFSGAARTKTSEEGKWGSCFGKPAIREGSSSSSGLFRTDGAFEHYAIFTLEQRGSSGRIAPL